MVKMFINLFFTSWLINNKAKTSRLAFFLAVLGTAVTPFKAYSFQSEKGIAIKGVVVSETDNFGIPGAAISIKGTAQGTVTDAEGHFKITVPSEGAVLVFSFLGFEKKEIKLGNQTEIKVSLVESHSELDEVVVVGFGEQKRVSVTGAISSIGEEEISRISSPNVANSLAGKITGLATIQSSGQPGADNPSIFLRGVSTLNPSNSQPLMIVDGVIRNFTQLDPNEIESISVLKDASATAVYGVRGANGVIIVTTKRGKTGKAKISASYSTGVQQPTRLLEFTDSYTYAKLYNEAELNDNPNLTEDQLKFSPEALEAFRTGSDPLIYPNTNWLDYMLKKAAVQKNANVNISGGTKKMQYFVSLGYLDQDGLFKTFDTEYDANFGYKRYNYRSNLDINVTNTTQVNVTVGGRAKVINRPNTTNNFNELFRDIYWSVPFAGSGIIEGKRIVTNDLYIPGQKVDPLQLYYGRGFTNSVENTLNFDINLNQKLDFVTKGLNASVKGAYNTGYTYYKIRNSSAPSYSAYYRKDADPNADPDDKSIIFRRSGAYGNLGFEDGSGNSRNYYFETRINYNRNFNGHNVGGLLLYNQNKTYYPKTYTDIPTGLIGLVGRGTYDYKSKYFVDFSIGYNGSENFAVGKRFGVFPAISGGWILTQEPFMKDATFINFLKLRASYGKVGSDKLNDQRFLYLPDSYNPQSGGYSFGSDNPSNATVAVENQIGNGNVTWETAYKQNYAMELAFLDGDLAVNFDYFREFRNNILTNRGTVPDFVAYNLPAVNIGEVQNRGFEAEIKWNRSVQKKFHYWVNLNVSHSKNKILFMDEVPQEEDYLYKTGNPVGQPFGYVFDRFFTENDINNENIPDQQVELKPGDMIYKDLNGDGVINQNDVMPIGWATRPGIILGANMGFKVGKVDFSMSWAGASQASRLLDETYRVAFGFTDNRSLLQYMADERWTPETADQANYPRLTFTNKSNNTKDSDFWLRDASYLRLKNIELGYTLSQDFLKTVGVGSLRFYANGFNLLTFDKLKLTDPEAKTGSDSQYPLIKLYNIGVKANF